MLSISRRSFFSSLAAGMGILAAPAIIKLPGLLMPIKAQPVPRAWHFDGVNIIAGENIDAGDFVWLDLSGVASPPVAYRVTGQVHGQQLGDEDEAA